MAALDDMLAMEEEIGKIEEILDAHDIALPLMQNKLQQVKDEITKNEALIDALRANLDFLLWKAPVILLDDYKGIRFSLRAALSDRIALQAKLQPITIKIKSEEESLPFLRARLEEIKRVYFGYGQLLLFRRPDDQR